LKPQAKYMFSTTKLEFSSRYFAVYIALSLAIKPQVNMFEELF
jgi:hypothetical protein